MVSANGEQQGYPQYQWQGGNQFFNQEESSGSGKVNKEIQDPIKNNPETTRIEEGPTGSTLKVNKSDRDLIDTVGGSGGIHPNTDNRTYRTDPANKPDNVENMNTWTTTDTPV